MPSWFIFLYEIECASLHYNRKLEIINIWDITVVSEHDLCQLWAHSNWIKVHVDTCVYMQVRVRVQVHHLFFIHSFRSINVLENNKDCSRERKRRHQDSRGSRAKIQSIYSCIFSLWRASISNVEQHISSPVKGTSIQYSGQRIHSQQFLDLLRAWV